MVVLALSVHLRWQLGRRRRGSALIVFARWEGWNSPDLWLDRAIRFGRSHFEVQHVLTRGLPLNPGSWRAATSDLNLLLDSAVREGVADASQTGELNLLVSMPWPVAWWIGTDLALQQFTVYQPRSGSQGFFAAVGFNRRLRAGLPGKACEMITVERELTARSDGNAVAIVLAISHLGVKAESMASCEALDVCERLVITLADQYERLVPDSREAFERLVREIGVTIRAFLEEEATRPRPQGEHAAGSAQARPPAFVYAAIPVSVATALGAFLGETWAFHLMHHVKDKYVEARRA